MSVSLSRSIAASNASVSGGLQFVGSSRISSAPLVTRAPSVYGGAGGYGTRISQTSDLLTYGVTPYTETVVVTTNEKMTMQNLNDRLSSYLDKVRSLESANRKLELQIREFCEKRTAVARDFTEFFSIISSLRAQISKKHLENQSVILQLDNAQLAADDFKMKYEMEMNMRTIAEADVQRLRGVRDNLSININDLNLQVNGLTDELALLKSTHAEEMEQLRIQHKMSTVDVVVDTPPPIDLSKVLQDVRQEYETLVMKNKLELEKWYQTKMDSLQSEINNFTTDVETFTTQLSELKRTFQSLEISRQSIITEIQCLFQSLEETKNQYSGQLSQLQFTINKQEVELQQLKISLEQQKVEYNVLLDIKMRLELEIAEYRRLLDGDQKKAVVISKVVEVEEQKPHIERRVRTIVEEVVDGKVVSSTVDTQVEEIQ